ncbi:hypothetical protein [Mucilaginibacter sp.]|uniref:hypothetical protein n=1 Tax=Mucilaginibacter sp. TaxID=1882438 RepID=UPI002628ED49|nr:hypothetical protein [Mucilaginibacter sp.]MDB4919872.1 hypothetical protein [Mucilaginibacter sp.]
MKKALLGFIALIGIFSMCSCTMVLYSHKQVMQRYTTKSQVTKDFGRPAEKRQSEGTEEWLYNYNGISTNSTFETNNVTQFSQYDRFVKFTFDGNGNVTKWESHGINKERRKPNPTATIVLVAGLVAFFIALEGVLPSGY